jgi:hypothetical protein
MDIAGLSMAMSTTRVVSDVSTAVLEKSLDTSKELGASFIKMMEQSVNPELGQNIDIRM